MYRVRLPSSGAKGAGKDVKSSSLRHLSFSMIVDFLCFVSVLRTIKAI